MSQTTAPENVVDVVEENRDVLELVAEGNDDSARMAQNILDAAEDTDA